jgi:ketosteroid isomerase-like protein
LLVPVIALALPDDATLPRLLIGTWPGTRRQTVYRADGTWVLDPPDECDNTCGKWRIEHGKLIETWRFRDESSDSTSTEEIIELTEKTFKSRIISQEGPGKPEGQVLPSEILHCDACLEEKISGRISVAFTASPEPDQIWKSVDGEFNCGLDGAMKAKSLLVSIWIVLLSFAFVSSASAAGSKKADEQAVRDADAEWSKVAGAKDLDKTVSFYADDALVLPPNASMVTSKDGIRNLWKGFFDSLTEISWKTTRVEMAKSGDMGYFIGTYAMTMKDGTEDRGKYCEVWKKQADGKWKVAVDMFSSDFARHVRGGGEKIKTS